MKTKKTALFAVVAMILAVVVAPAYAIEPVEPKNADSIWLEPSLTTIAGLFVVNIAPYAVGDLFNITLFANCSYTCGGWSMRLIYEKATINALRSGYTGTGGTKSEFFQNINTVAVSPTLLSHNATHNRVDFGESAFPPSLRDPGYGSLCFIEFNVTNASPFAFLTFTDLPGSLAPKTYFLNSTGGKPPINAYGGTVVPEIAPTTILSILTLLAVPTAILVRRKKL